jgi:hypothetical protein
VYVVGAARRAAMWIVVGVEDLVQRTRDCRTGWILGNQTVERLDDVVCGLYRARADKEHEFLG